ncbi:hypothetical protein [Roseateles koreensis]|uniref:Outer membrane protein beta-barrel domain-containing protein n=1 Tax=Roseateles koreensis TaxID=2987526 RepID=A0ABT5KRK9_9BURK|nr:hypothetical protein [Roseateles koreensis]MDC8785003.1 hypothetical protein [Roseateles koreensis]
MKQRAIVLFCSVAAACFSAPAMADEGDAAPFKLTAGLYDYGSSQGKDLNLRWRGHDSDAWVGYYQDPDFGKQWRAGLDHSFTLNDWAQLQPSLQLATQGFIGGSINLQLGTTWYTVMGLGRTNVRPYFNLNFDPNDAITAGVGWQGAQGQNLSLTLIADDRLGTGQRHVHALARWPVNGGDRLTVDLLYKQGMGDAGYVYAWGLSVAYDFPHWFIRLTRDGQQNFSTQDAVRLAVGTRF